jgi:predicted secreted acid phosphatase
MLGLRREFAQLLRPWPAGSGRLDGDNILDFPGLNQAVRLGDESAFADFGSRFVVVPNPMYGSWVGKPRNG